MLINPFKLESEQENKENEDNVKYEPEEIILKLRDYVINNYMDYLKENMKDKLKEKLNKDIYDLYGITDEQKVNNIITILLDKMFGYGILQKYIESKDVTDIRVVKFDSIYIKRKGIWEKVEDKFTSEEEFNEYVRYCALKNNSNINFDVPIITVSDKIYNLRIEMGIEPANVKSPNIVIRIHRFNEIINLETLFLVYDMLDASSYKILLNAVNEGKNIIFSGKGGSGKTTLLRAILQKIPDEKAISINEETAELNIQNKNVIQREVIENREESKKISLEKLMKQSLVMSNDVIVVGEMKGSETSVFIDAIGTGHIGYATVHSDSAKNTINRLITLFKRDVRVQAYKEEFVKELLINSIDYIVYLENFKVVNILKKVIKNNVCMYDNIYERKSYD